MKKYFSTGTDNFELGTELVTDFDGKVVDELFNYASYTDMLRQQFNLRSQEENFFIKQKSFNDLFKEQIKEILADKFSYHEHYELFSYG